MENQTDEDGTPYLNLIWANPQSIQDLFAAADAVGEAPLAYQIDVKAGNSKWTYEILGDIINGNGLYIDENDIVLHHAPCNPTHLLENLEGINAADLESNVFYFRVRYSYLNPHEDYDEYIYSPFSNVAAIGTGAIPTTDPIDTVTLYQAASDWAKSELQKANDLGLIPAILKGADMTKPIMREEFAELAVVLYEKVTGKKSEPISPNPFTDTANLQILKAYNLGITSGTSQTTFSTKVLINREQCAAMLFRAIKAIHPQGDYSVAGVKDFPDQKNISSWAVEATQYMNKIGVIAGDARGNFMPKATTPAQEAAGYGMATREQAIALSLRTNDKAPEIKASSADISIPDADANGKTSPVSEVKPSGTAADSGSPFPAEIVAKLPGWMPASFLDIPIAADAEFIIVDSMLGTSSGITVMCNSQQTLEALYQMYFDFLQGSQDFYTYRQDDGRYSFVTGVRGGYKITIIVSLSGGNQVDINVQQHVEY